MEAKELSLDDPDNGLESDEFSSWEEFYGPNNEDLVGSILEMYDLLIGRSPTLKEELSSQRAKNDVIEKSSFKDIAKNLNKNVDINKKSSDNWCDFIKRNWNCRCAEKSVIEAITSCAACNTKEPKIRSTDIRNSKIFKSGGLTDSTCLSEPSLSLIQLQNSSKCELVTCPAGFSTPTTPIQQRLIRQSPLPVKRNEDNFRYVTRPSSISSLTSSSSSSSGASSCYGTRRLGIPHKSSAYLASIESLEDNSDIESRVQKDESSRSSKESEGSEDSGVHSPCTSLPQDRPKYCDPHLSYMDKVVMEIIETEKVYVGDLRKIIEGYLLKWRSLPDFPLADRLDCLFGNIEAVFHFNSLFLTELEQCGLDPVKVARCFVKNNSGFSVYTDYCTNYPRTVSLLTELMRQEGTVRLFRERQTALQHTLPLGSYLLKPVQRILKYHLLLQNIVKQYSKGFDGYPDILNALRTMTEIAQHINDMKRRHEHEVRVQEIQSLLLGWEGEDLTTFGELCAEGAFRMFGAKAARHIFLFDKMVLITKKKEGGILDYKAHIDCSNLMLIESVPGEPFSFHIIPFDNPKLQYTLQCRNLDQKREWTLQLKRVILENYNAVIPSHARQLVMELGQNRTEVENLTNKILPKRQHLAPEYLEKRKQGRRKAELNLTHRVRKNKKLGTGEKLENQFDKLKPHTVECENIEEKSITLSERNKKRESELVTSHYNNDKKTETSRIKFEENPKDSKRNFEFPEKLEIKTLEQIVAQILKQNRDFDKILKRQTQNLIGRGREFGSRRRKKKDQVTDEQKEMQETLKDFKGLAKIMIKEDAEAAKQSFSSDSDYATLLDENQGCESSLENGLVKPENSQELLAKEAEDIKFSEKIPEDYSKVSIDEEGIPTSPSVWLRQQIHHLPAPTKKAGSLPRSFQIGLESSTNNPRCFRDFRISIERPFTIASDKLPPTMLFEGMERFCRSQFRRFNSDAMEDGSLTESLGCTPGTSSDQINIHPEHKIYRSILSSNILKNMLSSVQTKLSHIRTDTTYKESDKKVNKERKASRVALLVKQAHRSLRTKQKGKQPTEYNSDAPFEMQGISLSEYKQGSSSIGARLANFTETDYRISRVRPSKKAAALLGVYADSVLSLTSISSTAEKLSNNTSAIILKDQESFSGDSDDSADSYYERTFEAMDEKLLIDLEENFQNFEEGIKNTTIGTPPPVPVKPKKELILKKISEINSADLNLELEKKEGNAFSATSTSLENKRNHNMEVEEILSKGWVKHVVGKIQKELKN